MPSPLPTSGLYVHVPFCAHRCGYCDFATWEGRERLIPDYLDALESELTRLRAAHPWRPFQTVFIGGGTPSLLDEQPFQRLLSIINAAAPPSNIVEGTMEANPESFRRHHLAALPHDWQRTRVSLGVQDFTDAGATLLERGHTREQVHAAAELVKQAHTWRPPVELNLDLIIGLPGQTLPALRTSLERAVALEPDHLSVYLLTIEPGTPFARSIREGNLPAPDDDFQADAYFATLDFLSDHGYQQYEISNFSTGLATRSYHNIIYWRQGDYLGAGVSAASHFNGQRWSNVRSLQAYLKAVNAEASAIAETEALDAVAREEERVWLALRLNSGLPVAGPEAPAASIVPALERARSRGILSTQDDRWRLTREGLVLSNELFAALMST